MVDIPKLIVYQGTLCYKQGYEGNAKHHAHTYSILRIMFQTGAIGVGCNIEDAVLTDHQLVYKDIVPGYASDIIAVLPPKVAFVTLTPNYDTFRFTLAVLPIVHQEDGQFLIADPELIFKRVAATFHNFQHFGAYTWLEWKARDPGYQNDAFFNFKKAKGKFVMSHNAIEITSI